jgi:hypothetical protein
MSVSKREEKMIFKNSLKLFCSNFGKVWKYFFYSVIVTGIVIGLMMPFLNEIRTVVLANWTNDILNAIPSTGLLYGSNVAGMFSAVWAFCYGCVTMLFTNYLWVGVYLAFLMIIVWPFLMNIGKYAVHESLYNYMSSQTKSSYCAVLVKTLRHSSAYAILKTLMSIIWKAILVVGSYALFTIEAPLFDYFLPVIVIVVGALATAIAQTFISGWAPASVVYNFNVVKSYNIGFKAVVRKYGRILSTGFMINMIFIFLIMGFGVVSASVFIPLYYGLNNMFEMVMFFSSQGMRYYVDADTVVTPKKLEQQDTIEKTKYLL